MARVEHPVSSGPGWSSSFLSLPPPIRRRIYILAGLVRFCPIDLNHESPRKVEYLRVCTEHLDRVMDSYAGGAEARLAVVSRQDVTAGHCCFYRSKRFEGRATFPGPGGIDCVCGPLPAGLLLVCRAIHAEVAAILYSENRFKICRSAPGGLGALSRLGVAALGLMTGLHVRLNACGCVPGHVCSLQDRVLQDPFFSPCPSCHYGCKCGWDLPLSAGDPDTRTLVQEWESLAAHLARWFTPGRLRLSVVGDTLDLATARQILHPILGLPLLATCAVRLGQRPDHALRLLAETTIRQVTGRARVPDESFPWSRLSPELQLRILRYSGLLASRPIEWIEGDGFGKPSCCGQCTDTLETCCCPGLHAGFTSVGCACWSWPRDHFLVNSTFRHQALQVFFNSNTFSVHTLSRDFESEWDEEDGGCEHRSVLGFLQSLPRDGLQHIRSLRIAFTGFRRRDLCPGTRSLTNWGATLAFIRQHLTLAQLSLTVCSLDAREDDGYVTGAEDCEWQFYQRMVGPATILRGVRRLIIVFPPTSDAAREARNRVRERELRVQALGPESAGTTTTPGEGQGHPAGDQAGDGHTIILGPSGEQIWPIPLWN